MQVIQGAGDLGGPALASQDHVAAWQLYLPAKGGGVGQTVELPA